MDLENIDVNALRQIKYEIQTDFNCNDIEYNLAIEQKLNQMKLPSEESQI